MSEKHFLLILLNAGLPHVTGVLPITHLQGQAKDREKLFVLSVFWFTVA
ncbi:TPA: hypothetical protein ACUK23_001537 [Escherichia coli]|nr:hypothetical protein [Escherichia coli]EEZ6562377.1 hypothetical protein [Escherichia coli]EFH6116945.1 hypothetical protein [Escherichia coli]EFK5430851.1 hypothetical protein [Escherichia coli]EGB9071487.1 hypothetical protein [Escherichia coli]EJQ5987844.1 hypothetical protein [Escherichia coli]